MSSGGTHMYAKARNSKGTTIPLPNANSNTAPATHQFNLLGSGNMSKASPAFITHGSFPVASSKPSTAASTTPTTTPTTTATATWTTMSSRNAGTMPPAAKPPATTTSAPTPGASSSTPIPVTTKAVAPGLVVITPTPSSTVPTASGSKGFVPLSPTTGVFGSGSAAAGSSPATATIGTLFGAPTTSKAAVTGKLFGAPSTSTTSGTTAGDLFGSPATASTSASGGLFGPPTTTTCTSGGLFGASATTTTTSGGFYGKPATLSTGGLFGTPTATPGSLFGAVSAANNHASIFGAPSTNTATGDKFGPPTTSRSQTAHSALSLTFRLIWPVSGTKGEEGHKVLIKTKDGNFEFICTVREVFRLVLGFTADDPDQFRRLGMFKGAVIQDVQKVSTVYTPLTQIGFTYTLSVPFRKEFLVLKDGVYEVEITLTNQTTTIVQTNPAYHCETLLERLLQDSASHDVFFEFEVTEDASSLNTLTRWLLPRSEEKQSSEESDTETDEKTAVGGQKDARKGKDVSSSKASQSAMPALDSIENVSNPTIKGKQFSRRVTVGAHSSVLSQYKYFQSTYFSPAIDRSAEKTVIKMLEDEVAVFRLLLQFLYLGQLKPRTVPLFVTRDTIDSVSVPTWEDVFLTAHRYEVPELAALAADKIVANLERKWAIHFLFRTGYKFANLRHNVIHFVVANNMPQVVQKELQQTYLTHPECSAVFGEIMTELWNVHTRANASPLAESGPIFGASPFSTTTPITTAASPATSAPLFSFPKSAISTPSTPSTTTTTTAPTPGSGLKNPIFAAGSTSPVTIAQSGFLNAPAAPTMFMTRQRIATPRSARVHGHVHYPTPIFATGHATTTTTTTTTTGPFSNAPVTSFGSSFLLPNSTTTPTTSTGLAAATGSHSLAQAASSAPTSTLPKTVTATPRFFGAATATSGSSSAVPATPSTPPQKRM